MAFHHVDHWCHSWKWREGEWLLHAIASSIKIPALKINHYSKSNAKFNTK